MLALREARKAAGLSAEQLGARLGLSAQAVRAMERSSPCVGRAFQLARLLECDPKAFTYSAPTSGKSKPGTTGRSNETKRR